MTISTNSNKLDTHPIAKLVFGCLAGNNEENNRTIIGTARVCKAWRQNLSMIADRVVATMTLGLPPHRTNMRPVLDKLLNETRIFGSIPNALQTKAVLKQFQQRVRV